MSDLPQILSASANRPIWTDRAIASFSMLMRLNRPSPYAERRIGHVTRDMLMPGLLDRLARHGCYDPIAKIWHSTSPVYIAKLIDEQLSEDARRSEDE